MRLVRLTALLLAGAGAAHAGDLDLRVLLSGQIAPGIYGQVELGNGGPPPLVYAQPMLIEPQYAPPPPIYLHVPPGHAKHWRQHCREYNACGRPVYFVRSQEYDPDYQRHYRDHERERELARERWEAQQRDQDREPKHWRDEERGHGHGEGHGHGHDRDDDHDH